MKFRGCDSINLKESIQAGYRNDSRIVNYLARTSMNFTNLAIFQFAAISGSKIE